MRDMSKNFEDSTPWQIIKNARNNQDIFLYKPDDELYHVYENSFNIDNLINMMINKRLK